MKKFLLFLLLLNPCVSFCQLPTDSLKNVCINQFHKDKFVFFKPTDYIGGMLDVKVSFDDYFDRLKIIDIYDLDSIVTYNSKNPKGFEKAYIFSGANVFLIYIIDIYTGKIINVENINTFNSIMNSANKRFSNLEKCFLYLLLNHIRGGIAYYREYPKDLSVGKEMSYIGALVFNGSVQTKEMPEWLWSKMHKDIINSTSKCISIFTRMNKSDEYIACEYNFIFDESDNLSEINNECFK